MRKYKYNIFKQFMLRLLVQQTRLEIRCHTRLIAGRAGFSFCF